MGRDYGFVFTTRSRDDDDLDSRVTSRSPTYFINCRVETFEEIVARNFSDERILRKNMRANGWDRLAITKSGWPTAVPIKTDDIVLDFDLPEVPT